jgi:hypothetical protein
MIRALSTVALATAALLSLTAPAQAAESASFIGSGASQFFGFEIDYEATLTGSVVSSFSGLAGYDITSVTIDGVAFPDLLPAVGADYYEFSLSLAAGVHTIAIKGTPYGGSYVGSYTLTPVTAPVPEVNALALSLAGMGAIGFATSRRGRRT